LSGARPVVIMRPHLAITILIALLGTLAGTIFSALLLRRTVPPKVVSDSSRPEPLRERVPIIVQRDDDRLADRLSKLEAQMSALPGSPAEDPASASQRVGIAEPPSSDPEARLRELRVYHEGRLQKHNDEPVDAQWSSSTQQLIKEDLGVLSQAAKRFTIEEVDCRTVTCVVRVRWSNYDSAFHDVGHLASAQMRPSCATGIVLPEVTDRSAPVAADLIMDCASWKKGDVGSGIRPSL